MKLHGMLKDGEVVVSRDDLTNFLEHKCEYSDGHGDEPPTARWYLECEEGKEFSITFHKPPRWNGHHICSHVYVDGRHARGGVLTEIHKKFEVREMQGVDADGCRVLQRFKFDKLSVTEDEAGACKDENILKSLGTIVLDFTEGSSGPSTGRTAPTFAAGIGAVHEKAKKGLIGSSIAGGTSRPFVAEPVSAWAPLRPGRVVEYRVIINYRTREMLQATRVIDLPPPQKMQGAKRGSTGLEERDQNSEGSTKRKRGASAVQATNATQDVKPKIKVSSSQAAPTPAAGTSKNKPIDLTRD